MSNPNLVYAQRHYESAIDCFEKGQYNKAIQQINKAIQNAPMNPDMHATKGVFLQRMNNIEQAEKAYEEALNLYEGHSFTRFNLGIIRMQAGHPSEAIQEWKVVLETDPNDIEALFNIGVALVHLNQRKEAINFFMRIIEIDKKYAQAYQNLAVIYRDHSDFDNARFYFNKLKEVDSTYSEASELEIENCNRLEAKEKENLKDTIGTISNSLSDLMLDDSEYSNALLAVVEERFDDAMKIAEKMLKHNPDDDQAYVVKGQAQRGLGKPHAAIATFTHMLSKNPRSTEAMYNLGEIFQSLGQLEKALEYFERLIEWDPEHTIALQNISEIREKLPHRRL
jgi:tetratricopeptide (TPR) repeat protein